MSGQLPPPQMSPQKDAAGEGGVRVRLFAGTFSGICWMIFSAFCFAVMAAAAHEAGEMHFTQKAFFRNFIALVFMLPLVFRERKNISLPKGAVGFLFMRAAAGSLGIFGNFYALDRIPLSDAAILNKMSTFFSILFSLILLGEAIKFIPLLCTVAAFAGCVFVIKPSANLFATLPSLAGFVGGMGAGLAYTCVRKLGKIGCPGAVVILFFSLFSCLLCLPFMLYHYTPLLPRQILFLAATGFAGLGGQFGVTKAYFYAPARDVSIYGYTQILFSAALGFFFFGQLPDLWSWIGYAVITLMAIFVFLYSRRAGESNE